MSRRKTKTKRAIARDDSRNFEEFMATQNEEIARREAEEARAEAEANERFAEGFLAGMRKALGIREEI